MRITETIEQLRMLLAEHGDLEVRAYAYGDITCHPAVPVLQHEEFGGVYVLIEDGVG
ncbi:hypothetical protein OIC43_37320 [Streptomyces sp. NBC_00825]|uniref:hypothetical protein n=1 Tax=unclassified Streptomyces TaxID=2593676 RepID=UPI002ED0D213|nr:hypothetical protein OG832_06370 [Streptomyces sp. NBC_00826]WTH94299.1 hypothetical protein OIC43_37320 [Streptomyces sp. NBC_00825]WTI03034.1 hypothetical protein OHA23_37300 [Streptomyces sp. NBC_00822]